MQWQNRINWLLAFVAIVASGCTSAQLRKDTVNQMATVHDLQQQQVLDNLAMFVHNRDSYPYFSTVVGGACSLTDGGQLGTPNTFTRGASGFLYSSLGINPSVSRSLQESWQINPVNDSIKLTLMRCAYQHAVTCCFGEPESPDCPNCVALYNAFYGDLKPPVVTSFSPSNLDGTPAYVKKNDTIILWGEHLQGSTATVLVDGKPVTLDSVSDDVHIQFKAPEHAAGKANLLVVTKAGQCRIDGKFAYLSGPEVPLASSTTGGGGSPAPTTHAIGMITPDCLSFSSKWFCWGNEEHVPTDCPCQYVGHYCDTYIWVPPCGVNELTKLTILIQDIAYYDFSNVAVVGNAGTGLTSRRPSAQFPPLLLDAQTLRTFTPTAPPTMGQ
jgi:hypothetical protein